MDSNYNTDDFADGMSGESPSPAASDSPESLGLFSKPSQIESHPASLVSRTQKTTVEEKPIINPKIRRSIVGELEDMVYSHTNFALPLLFKTGKKSPEMRSIQRRDALSFLHDLLPEPVNDFQTPREIQYFFDSELKKHFVEEAGSGLLRAVAYMHQDLADAFEVSSRLAEHLTRKKWNKQMISFINSLQVNEVIPIALCSDFLNQVNEGELISTFATETFYDEYGTALGAYSNFDLKYSLENSRLKENIEPILKSLNEFSWKSIEFRYLEYQLERCDLSFSGSEEFQSVLSDFVQVISTQIEEERSNGGASSNFNKRPWRVNFFRNVESHSNYGKTNYRKNLKSNFENKNSQKSLPSKAEYRTAEKEGDSSIFIFFEKVVDYINSPEFSSNKCKVLSHEKLKSLKLTYEMIKFTVQHFGNIINLEGYLKNSKNEVLFKKLKLFEETITTASALVYSVCTIYRDALFRAEYQNVKLDFIKRQLGGFEVLAHPRRYGGYSKPMGNFENYKRIISEKINHDFYEQIQSKIVIKTIETEEYSSQYVESHFKRLDGFQKKGLQKLYHEYFILKASFKEKIEFYKDFMVSTDDGFMKLMNEVFDWSLKSCEMFEAVIIN